MKLKSFKLLMSIILLISMLWSNAIAAFTDSVFEWQKVDQALPGDYVSVASNGKIFVSVGYRGSIRYSSDGVKWQESDSGTSKTLWKIIWDGSRFVAAGDKVVLQSVDGIHWTQLLDNGTDFKFVSSNGKTIVALGEMAAYATQDGINWITTVFDGKTACCTS